MIKLTPRQQAIVNFMPRCGAVADIGCDHGKLGAYLLQQGLTQRVIACDISEPSLNKARGLARELKLADMEFRLGDGMQVLAPNEADCVVIAGMGGSTVRDILLASAVKPEHIIAQPMNATKALKECLSGIGYYIADETVVKEGKRFYSVILIQKGKKEHTEREIEYPMPAILRKEPACREYLIKKLELCKDAVKKAKDGARLNAQITVLEEMLIWYQ